MTDRSKDMVSIAQTTEATPLVSRVFANAEAADEWFWKNDPEGMAFGRGFRLIGPPRGNGIEGATRLDEHMRVTTGTLKSPRAFTVNVLSAIGPSHDHYPSSHSKTVRAAMVCAFRVLWQSRKHQRGED
jgi:hypothetical protein